MYEFNKHLFNRPNAQLGTNQNVKSIRQHSLPPKNLWKKKEHREELINLINLNLSSRKPKS